MTRPEPEDTNRPDHAPPPIVEAIPLSLIDRPLDYILADHYRMRSVCGALRRFAQTGQATRIEADRVSAFLEQDLPLHHDDEDQDLFPAVRRRALPEDDLGSALARLSADHRLADPMVDTIIATLGATGNAAIVTLERPVQELMRAYAASEHRHLAIENGIVMAIARIRLKPADLKAISRGMKHRRGVEVDVPHA
jgi:hypothetical protein